MRSTRCCALVIARVLHVRDASAQSAAQSSLEALIRRLDHAEAQALLRRDTTELRTIWARDFTVNNPRNSITRGGEEVVALIRSGTIDYSSFAREIETILFHGNAVIVMGSETITPANKAPLAGADDPSPLYAFLDAAERRVAPDGATCERGLPVVRGAMRRGVRSRILATLFEKG